MNKSKFEKAFAKVQKQAVRRYGEDAAQYRIKMSEQSADDLFAKNGKAWRVFLICTIAKWVNNKKVSVFLPPSPETLAWGGFLGGEWV